VGAGKRPLVRQAKTWDKYVSIAHPMRANGQYRDQLQPYIAL
jgi:hypothetical protein